MQIIDYLKCITGRVMILTIHSQARFILHKVISDSVAFAGLLVARFYICLAGISFQFAAKITEFSCICYERIKFRSFSLSRVLQ